MDMRKRNIDVMSRPGIMLPPGYVRSEDINKIIDNKNLSSQVNIDYTEPGNQTPSAESSKKEEIDPENEKMKSLFEKFDEAKSDSHGWVQKNEVKIAKERIKKALGFAPPPMSGWYMALVVHEKKYAMKSDGSKSLIELANTAQDEEKFRNCCGLVISQGPECYTGPRFEEKWTTRLMRVFFNKFMKPIQKKPWCRVGDWVVFARHEGELMNYRGTPMYMIPDVKIYTPVENPDYVTRGF